jgi:hypothetical protein
VAIDVGKFDYEDCYDDLSDNFRELEMYLSNDTHAPVKMEVVKYILDKIVTFDPNRLLYNLFMNKHGGDWYIKHEPDMDKNDYTIISR